MLHIPNSKVKIVGLALGIVLAGGLLGDANASAATCEDENVPCVEVNFGTPQGSTSVQPGLSYYDSTKFYLPVTIGLKYTSMYSVKVYGSGSNLQSDSESIPSIGTDTSYEQLGKNGSEWGIRWNFGNVIEDVETNYHRVPASESDAESVVVENEVLPNSASIITKHLTLGFAVSVDSEQPSGSYTNTVTVAVVASPKDARSFFDVSTMQEMTPEICENTTTPAKTATTLFDTDGKHGGDANYVPETVLEDVRDGKEYLVRKLADGNCWMSQNLSLDLSVDKTLTNRDTDLTSKTEWTPAYTTQTKTGVVWAQNDGEDRSVSYRWDQYWDGTSFVDPDPALSNSQVMQAQRGNYYNWFAVTAGSGKSNDIATTTELGTVPGAYRIMDGIVQDSICPKGWTIPVGNTTDTDKTDGAVKSFYNLVQIYTGKAGNVSNATINTLYASPMSFTPSGYYNYQNGAISYAGGRQFYGTSTVRNADEVYRLNYITGTVHPGTYYGAKGHGTTVRCVAR